MAFGPPICAGCGSTEDVEESALSSIRRDALTVWLCCACRSRAMANEPPGFAAEPRPLVGVIHAAPGTSAEEGQRLMAQLADVGAARNVLFDKLTESRAEPKETPLNKGVAQLGDVLWFLGGTFSSAKDYVHQPLFDLFCALLDLAQGGKPPLIFDLSAAPKSRDRAKYLVRGILAAAADVLIAANMSREDVVKWWGRPVEANHALVWRDEINSRTRPAPNGQITIFNDLRPDPRQPVTLADAKRLAREWRAQARALGVDTG